ncbi:MAG: DUF1640 domain-containing protein [bacterium]|nr:DUF1640 domain-containing protein [bacterium]
MTAAFDTLAAARDLEKAGMDRTQAEAVANVVRAGQGELATKAGVDALREATRADLATVRGDLETALSAFEARLTWRLVIAAGVIVAAVKLIPAP